MEDICIFILVMVSLLRLTVREEAVLFLLISMKSPRIIQFLLLQKMQNIIMEKDKGIFLHFC